MSDEALRAVSMDILPFEVQAMILRYAVTEILHNVRRTDSSFSYGARLHPFPTLRLTSKTFNNVLTQFMIDGLPLEAVLKTQQLERLDYGLEALQMTADVGHINTRLSVPKLKHLYGRFWFNPDLSASTIKSIFKLLANPHSLNFAVKLENWILQHRQRSEAMSRSSDNVLVFEAGDWIVDAGDLQIKRVTRWQSAVPSKSSRISMYLSQEYGLPIDPVHERLGHDRRWYIEVVNDAGYMVVKCMINYDSKMVWDHLGRRLYDFEGRQFQFPVGTDGEEQQYDDEDEDGSSIGEGEDDR